MTDGGDDDDDEENDDQMWDLSLLNITLLIMFFNAIDSVFE